VSECVNDLMKYLRLAQIAIREEAEELLSEKRVISGAINIRTNKDKMKASATTLCAVHPAP